jgi:hypothetical protein
MSGGGGVYIKGNAKFWLTSGGTISGNTTTGAGGGVLVNGNVTGSYYDGTMSDEYGLKVIGGKITGNNSTSWTYPHGGGGVYVARGYFDLEGEVTSNAANRQGGGVFVHWGEARFNASSTLGNSTTITGNIGTGSSKAICNRGVTELRGTTQADYVYIWDYGDPTSPQSFTLENSVQIMKGIAFAFSADNKNAITLASNFTESLSDRIEIDLESRLDASGHLSFPLEPDWIGKTLIKGANSTLNGMLSRLHLNTFTGNPPIYVLDTGYEIEVVGTEGRIKKK